MISTNAANSKHLAASMLLVLLVAAAAYIVGGWLPTGIVIGVAILLVLLNQVWQMAWFKAFEIKSPTLSKMVKLLPYVIIVALLGYAIISYIFLHYVGYFSMPIAN
jgi:hypothetical protein